MYAQDRKCLSDSDYRLMRGKNVVSLHTEASRGMLLLWNYLHQWSEDRVFLYNIAPSYEQEASGWSIQQDYYTRLLRLNDLMDPHRHPLSLSSPCEEGGIRTETLSLNVAGKQTRRLDYISHQVTLFYCIAVLENLISDFSSSFILLTSGFQTSDPYLQIC